MLRRLCCGLAAAGAVVFTSRLAATGVLPPEEPAAPAVAPGEYRPPEDPQELLRIDDEIRSFFAQRIPPRASELERLRRILNAILEPDGLNFSYDVNGTFDARETFRRRSGNCAGFSLLVVAAARALGLDARFQSIERTTRWNRVGEVVVSVLHVNVRVSTDEGAYIVDLEPHLVPRAAAGAMNLVRDERAFALFYCNVGFEHLVQGRMDEALGTMELATQVDPTCASAWGNLATLRTRIGELRAARASFERSLRLDPRGEAVLDGYIGVLRQLGSPDDLRKAARFERKARALRDRNPYYQQQLAVLARDQGNLVLAEKHLRRAIRLQDDEPEFYVQWIAVLEQLGRERAARRAVAKLAKLRARLEATPIHIVP